MTREQTKGLDTVRDGLRPHLCRHLSSRGELGRH